MINQTLLRNIEQSILNNPALSQNSMMSNAINLYKRHDSNGLVQLADNMCKQFGTSYEEQKKKLGF